jgi:hypothetical protein
MTYNKTHLMGKNIKRINHIKKTLIPLRYVELKNFKNSKNFPKLIQYFRTSKVLYHT